MRVRVGPRVRMHGRVCSRVRARVRLQMRVRVVSVRARVRVHVRARVRAVFACWCACVCVWACGCARWQMRVRDLFWMRFLASRTSPRRHKNKKKLPHFQKG